MEKTTKNIINFTWISA